MCQKIIMIEKKNIFDNRSFIEYFDLNSLP